MTNVRSVSWADEMDDEAFNPPAVEYENTRAGYLAGLMALSGDGGHDYDSDASDADYENVAYDYQIDGVYRRSDRSAPRSAPPTYVADDDAGAVPPSYDTEVYGDQDADVAGSALDALYRSALQRVDDNHAGASAATRLHRGRAAEPDDRQPGRVGPDPGWWLPQMYRYAEWCGSHNLPLHSGVPYGEAVRGANWTDKQLKVASTVELNKYLAILRAGSSAYGSDTMDVGASHEVERVWGADRAERCTVTEVQFTYEMASCSVYFTWSSEHAMEVIDVSMSADIVRLRELQPVLADRVNAVIGAYTVAVMDGYISVPSVLQLNNAGLSGMKKNLQRTQHGASIRVKNAMPTHALVPSVVDMHGPNADCHTDFAYWERDRGVAHGRVRAGDVPPAQLVLLGASGGLSVTGALLVVRTTATNEVSLVVTTAAANMTYKPLMADKKRAPCVRDGLMSPIACAALHGDATGTVTVTVEDAEIGVATIISDGTVRSERQIHTLDLGGTRAALFDLAGLCGYTASMEPDALYPRVKMIGHGRIMVFELRYGMQIGARWESLVASSELSALREVVPQSSDSEIAVDWGASGLGRYLLSAYTEGGILRAKKIKVARKGHFAHLTYDDQGKRRIMAPAGDVINYVIDTEFVNVRRGGETLTYVYAIGIARIEGGLYRGSWAAMDSEENAEAMLSTLSGTEAERHRETIAALRAERVTATDMTELLLMIRLQLLGNPNVRIYAKGKDAEERMMSSSVEGGTRLFRSHGQAAGDIIRELGSVLPQYDKVAPRYGWTKIHNPAKEAVLFAHISGLCALLPDERLVGTDGLNTIIPPASGHAM